jgi:hypothetical protein
LENKIKVQLLVVSSCYIAGTNVNNVYGEIKLGTQQPNSFPIIIQGLNDIETFSAFPMCDMPAWIATKKIALNTSQNFIDFFQQANKQESNYREIIKPLMHDKNIANEPQIKMPGLEWFSIMDIDNKIVSIGAILAKTRDPQKVLDVASFFKKNPKAIVLYTDDLPFELKIDLKSLKAIVSMMSPKLVEGNLIPIIHRIRKISTEGHSPIEILKLFRPITYANGQKWFFIDEINGTDVWKDVVIEGIGKESIHAYFKDKGVLYKFNFNFNNWRLKIDPVPGGSDDERDYNEKLDIVRNKYLGLSKKTSLKNQEITAEEIKNIENVLKKKHEKQTPK